MEVLTRKLDRSMRLQIPQNFASELGLEPDRRCRSRCRENPS